MNLTTIPLSKLNTGAPYRWKRVEPCIYLRGKNYYIVYRARRKLFRESIGTSLQMARIVLMKRRVQIKEEKFFEYRREKKTTFDEAVKDFMERSRNVNKPSSIERNEYSAKQVLKSFSRMKLNMITPVILENYRSKRLQEDKKRPATVNKEMAFIKAVFNNAIRNEKASKNPVSKLVKLKENEQRTRYLTQNEIRRVLNKCPKNFLPIVQTALLTGMRKGELLNLKKKNIDFDRQTIMVENTKSGKPREIPMSPRLMEILKKCYNNSKSEYVFTSRLGTPYRHIHAMFDRILAKVGVEDFRFHDLRHTAASHMVMSGIDLLTVKEILGHSTVKMTERYAHLSQPHKRQAMEKLSNTLFTICSQSGKMRKGNKKSH